MPLLLAALLAAPAGTAPMPDLCADVATILEARPLPADAFDRLVRLGPPAAAALEERLVYESDPAVTLLVLETLAVTGSSSSDAAIRPHLFSADPTLAAAATRALAGAGRGRSAPALERLLREDRSFAQTHAAIEGLAAHAPASSFPAVLGFVEDEGRDPVLRAEAARALAALDAGRARKWLRSRAGQPGTNPFLLAEIARLTGVLVTGPPPRTRR